MPALQIQKIEPNGVVYADPSKPTTTVRFKSSNSVKSLRGANTKNFVCEIIGNDETTVQVGGIDATDALSVRIRTSGSLEGIPRLKVLLRAMAAQLDGWVDENVLTGFNPVTPPTIP